MLKFRFFHFRILCYIACVCVFIFSIHVFFHQNTMIEFPKDGEITNSWISQLYLPNAISFHDEYEEFAKRPVTNFILNNVVKFTNINPSECFVLVSFFFLFLNGCLVFYLSKIFFLTDKIALINLSYFFFLPSTLFSFFVPVYSYDEPVQYFFLLLSFIFFKKNKIGLLLLFSTLAMIARESSLFMLIGFQIVDFFEKKTLKSKSIIPLFFAVSGYFVFQYFYTTHLHIQDKLITNLSNRWNGLHDNFYDFLRSTESLICFFIVCVPSIYLFLRTRRNYIVPKSYYSAFCIILLVNTIVVYCFATAREFRLLNLPLLLLTPFWGKMSIAFCESVKENIRIIEHKWKYNLFIIICILFLILTTGFAKFLFFDTYHISIAEARFSFIKFYAVGMFITMFSDFFLIMIAFYVKKKYNAKVG
jgi:hypothetical protein